MNSQIALELVSEITDDLNSREDFDSELIKKMLSVFRYTRRVVNDFQYMSEEIKKARKAWEQLRDICHEHNEEEALRLHEALWIDAREMSKDKARNLYYNSKNNEVCSRCNGAGNVKLSEWVSSRRVCPKCNGSGKKK